MKQEYKTLPAFMREKAHAESWSIENREGHEAQNRDIEYMGSVEEDGGRIWDYYRDDAGAWWYGNRWRERDGRIVSAEIHIFGHSIKRR